MTRTLILLASLAMLSGCASLAFSGATAVGVTSAQERSMGGAVDDYTIDATIHHMYLQTDVNDLLINVGVTVWEGRVLLTGSVDKHETAVKAVELAWKAEGVKEVINELFVNPDGTAYDKARDEWIEKQIEARLVVTRGIQSINYTVEVAKSVVFLIGTAQDKAEVMRVMAIARTTKGAEKVVSHIILKDDPRRTPRDREPDLFDDPKQTPQKTIEERPDINDANRH